MVRTVTVLFSEVVEPTGDAHRAHLDAIERAARSRGGSREESAGAGLCVIFDAASDAVRAAVDIQRELAAHNMQACIGLHVGELSADEDNGEHPVAVARRLCERALPGQVVASMFVRGLAGARGGFEFREIARRDQQDDAEIGVSEVVWEIEEPKDLPVPTVLARIARFSLVGRTDELDKLRATWKACREGAGRVVFVAGEPGIGKTRLVTELARDVHDDGGLVLFGRCDEEVLLPCQPFVEALDHYIASCPPQVIREVLGPLGGELVRLVPGLDQQVPDLPAPFRGEPETERYRMFEAVTSLLTRTARERPLLLFLDDLHWADTTSMLLLRHIARTRSAGAIMTVGTYRDANLPVGHALADAIADLRHDGLLERIVLHGLGKRETHELINEAVGGSVTPDVVDGVHWETEGNPYFIEETVRHLLETDAIIEDAGIWSAPRPVMQVGIPETIKDVVRQRISRMSRACGEALSLASVIGHHFELRTLERLVQLDEDALLDALDEAVRAGLLTELPGPLNRYSFSHTLVRETLHSQLGALRRASLHNTIGNTLEEFAEGALDLHLPELAHHFSQAAPTGDASKAIHYSSAAGDQALARLGYEEASRYYARALELLDLLGPDDRRVPLLVRFGDAQLKAGEMAAAAATLLEAANQARATNQAEAMAQAVLGMATARGGLLSTQAPGGIDSELVSLLEATLDELPEGDSELRVRAMGRLASALYYLPESGDRRRSLADAAVAMAERIGDTPVLANALAGRHLALWGPDNLDVRLATANRMLECAQAMGELELTLQARALRLMDLLELGDLRAARDDLDAHDTESRELQQPLYEWYTSMLRGMEALLYGKWAEAERIINDTMAEGLRIQNPHAINYGGAQLFALWAGSGSLVQNGEAVLAMIDEAAREYAPARCAAAYLQSQLGRVDEAREHLIELARDDLAAIPHDSTWPISMRFLAETATGVGDRYLAARLYERLLPYAGRVFVAGPPPIACFGLASHYLGQLARAAGDLVAARHHLQDAIEQSEQTGAGPFAAEALLAYGELLIELEAFDDARDVLERALAHAIELNMEAVAEHTQTVLATVEE